MGTNCCRQKTTVRSCNPVPSDGICPDPFGFGYIFENLDRQSDKPKMYVDSVIPLDENQGSALLTAITAGRLRVVQYLIKTGARVNNETSPDQTPLRVAALCKHPEICSFLISEGADVNARDSVSATPLYWAVHKGCKDTVLALIECGADVNVQNNRKRIPFHAAAAKSNVKMMHLLFLYGADPEARDFDECTPLHICAIHGHYAAARFLVVGICVSLDVVNKRNQTPFYCAMLERYRYILDLLVMAGYNPQKEQIIFDREPRWILGADDEQKLTQRYASVIRNVMKLQDLCIFRIRRHLGRRLPRVVEELHCPRKIKNMLKLTHIPHR